MAARRLDILWSTWEPATPGRAWICFGAFAFWSHRPETLPCCAACSSIPQTDSVTDIRQQPGLPYCMHRTNSKNRLHKYFKHYHGPDNFLTHDRRCRYGARSLDRDQDDCQHLGAKIAYSHPPASWRHWSGNEDRMRSSQEVLRPTASSSLSERAVWLSGNGTQGRL
jgi:hypothetical protein